MKDSTCSKTWEKTRVRHHIRHKSGRCQARLFLNGKDGKEFGIRSRRGTLSPPVSYFPSSISCTSAISQEPVY